MRKILFVTHQDFANVSTDIAYAINEHVADWDAKVYSCLPHPFAYPNGHHLDFDVSSEDQKREAEAWAFDGVDILVWAEESWPHSYYSFHNGNKDFVNAMLFGRRERLFASAKCFIFHAGHPFRENHLIYNGLDALSFKAQICSPDLWRLTDGRNGIPCFGKPFKVDMQHAADLWGGERRGNGQIVICHSPTNYQVKGTFAINAAMGRIVSEFPHVVYRQIGGPYGSPHNLPYMEACKQRESCHIYIDAFSVVGGVGMSSIEAMAAGMITLGSTQMVPSVVWQTCDMQGCPIVQLPFPTGDDGVDVDALYDALAKLCRRSIDELQQMGMMGAAWVHSKLGPRRFAERFLGSLIDT